VVDLPREWTLPPMDDDHEHFGRMAEAIEEMAAQLGAAKAAEDEANADAIKAFRKLVLGWAIAALVAAGGWGIAIEMRMASIQDTRFTAAEGAAHDQTDALMNQRIRTLERFHDMTGR